MSLNVKKMMPKIPQNCGVYLFCNKEGALIYVGKATSLKNRVRSYFSGKRTSRPIEEMIHEVTDIKWKETDSILEAIILESIYIKKYQPKYNVDGKDDKSWNYIVITKDEYPKIATIRQYELDQIDNKDLKKEYSHIFGPYPGLNTKSMMKLLAKLFNISFCRPGQKRPCLYYEMGQCLGVCIGEISTTDYKQKVIRPLIIFLQGGKKRLITTLKKRMEKASDIQDFEEANRLKWQIKFLERIHDMALLNKTFFKEELRKSGYKRIEGYDISNLGVTGKVGSMVVFENGEAKKSDYRRFKIRKVEKQSDVDCLEEVLERRLHHEDWGMPDIFLVDGGLPQVNRAKKILQNFDIKIPVLGIAKGPKRKKNEFILGNRNKDFILWVENNKNLLIQVRDEAHRFAISYQRMTRKL